jgi:ribosomal protein S18 acetylase RimI-like enzyme
VARNDSFRDHWGSQPMNEEQWDSFVGRSTFRPDLSFLAVAPDGTVAGFVLSSVSEDDWPGQGFSSAYIDLVGVTRAWRKRGIAPALLARDLRAIADAGLEKAVLDVDSDSPTGALGLYSGVGFAESNRSINFTKVF